MEKDPRAVARLAADREKENWRFRSFVKMSPRLRESQVDALAERVGRQAEAQMDCTTCGACCRGNWIPVLDEEIERLARRLKVSTETFRDRYVTIDPAECAEERQAIDAKPRPFLEGKLCSVYEDRPDPCRGYPYIGGDIAGRMLGIIERAGVCPIVFEMLERFKDGLGFRRYA